MTDNHQEIENLKQKIERANNEILEIRRESDIKFQQEISRMRNEFNNTSSRMQNDFAKKLKQIQDTFSKAYLAETERMRERYNLLTDQVKKYEDELDAAIRKLEEQQATLVRENNRKNQQYRQLANEAIERLQKNIEDVCTLPVEVFYPHSIQKYLDAGKEAKRLLEMKLCSLALTKADCASMAVNRVKEEIKNQLDKLEALFSIYKLEYNAIEDSLLQMNRRCLCDGNETILELSEIDLDYWSDYLFSELRLQLDEHKNIVNMGIQGWIKRCDGHGLDPTFLLDKEMQKLEMIPDKLSICISYALSACDCFNNTQAIANKAESLLGEQNYEFSGIAYGECKCGNDRTAGFKWYYEQYLHNEECVNTGKVADYREERVLTFKKRHLHGIETDSCKIYIVPYRRDKAVAYKVYIKLESDYIPKMMRDRLIHLFIQNGLAVEAAENECNLGTAEHRPFSLREITGEDLVADEACISHKYSTNY